MRQRLQKILAQAGCGSRRSCEKLIVEGRVCVNGRPVTKLGSTADVEKDDITLDGERIKTERKVYIAINKPSGYLCTSSDPWGRKKVNDLLGRVSQRVYTIGRLDRDAEGLVILTNDGGFAHRVAHPRAKVDKTYEVQIKGRLSQKAIKRLESGLWLDGKKTLPSKIAKVSQKRNGDRVIIKISEGRKRQLKRMFLVVGCQVKSLKRIAIGGLRLGNLPVGGYKFLKKVELERIFL